MATTIATGVLTRGGGVVTTSGGNIYAFFATSLDNMEVYKSTNGGSSFSRVGSGVSSTTILGSTNGIASISVAIDSDNIIHVLVASSNPAFTRDIAYCLFTTSNDSWGTWEEAATHTNNITSSNRYKCALALDSNKKPHIAYIKSENNMGGAYTRIYYTNKTGASWATPTMISTSTTHNYWHPDIFIRDSNYIEIHYQDYSYGEYCYRTYTTSWGSETTTVISALPIGHHSILYYSSAVNRIQGGAAGPNYFVYEDQSRIDTLSHTSISASTTAFYVGGAAISGSSKYIIYSNSSNDIVYIKNSGSGWSSATTLETGTFERVILEYAYNFEYQSNRLNYIFADSTTVYFNYIDFTLTAKTNKASYILGGEVVKSNFTAFLAGKEDAKTNAPTYLSALSAGTDIKSNTPIYISGTSTANGNIHGYLDGAPQRTNAHAYILGLDTQKGNTHAITYGKKLVTRIGYGSTSAETGYTLTVSKPSNVQAGDLMVAYLIGGNFDNNYDTNPSGWTTITYYGGLPSIRVCYKIATSNEPSSYQWTFYYQQYFHAHGFIGLYRYANKTNPINTSSDTYIENYFDYTIVIPATSITPTTSGIEVIVYATCYSSAAWVGPGGYYETTYDHSGQGDTNQAFLVVEKYTGIGATGTATAEDDLTQSHSGVAFRFLIADGEYSTAKSAYLKGHDTAKSNAYSFTNGGIVTSSSTSAFIAGVSSSTSSVNFYIAGTSPGYTSTYAYLFGSLNSTSNQPAFISGIERTSIPAYTYSSLSGTGSISAYTTGIVVARENAHVYMNAVSMGATFKHIKTASVSSGMSIDIDKPQETQEGDFLLAFIRGGFSISGTDIYTPSGWTRFRYIGNYTKLAIYYKFAEASEPSSFTWTTESSGVLSGSILSFYNVDTATPLLLGAATSSSSSPPTASVVGSGIQAPTSSGIEIHAGAIRWATSHWTTPSEFWDTENNKDPIAAFTVIKPYNTTINPLLSKTFYIDISSAAYWVSAHFVVHSPRTKSNISAFIDSIPYYASTSKSAFINGEIVERSDVPAYINGGINAQSSRHAFLFCGTAVSDNSTAFLFGIIQASSHTASYIAGIDTAKSSKPAILIGGIIATGSTYAYTEGNPSYYSGTPAYILGWQAMEVFIIDI